MEPTACGMGTHTLLSSRPNHDQSAGALLPVSRPVKVLTASGNLWEGKQISTFNSKLWTLDLSGVAGRSGALNGPLPRALRQVSKHQRIPTANLQMDGGILSFTSTLSLVVLSKTQKNLTPGQPVVMSRFCVCYLPLPQRQWLPL